SRILRDRPITGDRGREVRLPRARALLYAQPGRRSTPKAPERAGRLHAAAAPASRFTGGQLATFKYYAGGRVRRFHAASLGGVAALVTRGGAAHAGGHASQQALAAGHVANALRGRGGWHGTLFHDLSGADLLAQSDLGSGAVTLPTHTVVVDGARASELRWLRDKHGFEIMREGRQGKVLLRAPQGGAAGVAAAFDVGERLVRRGRVAAAHPNFIRALRHTRAPPPPIPHADAGGMWNLHNDGRQGL